MEANLAEIKIRGKAVKAPSTLINAKTVVVTGKWIRIAAVHDEEWLEGQVVDAPELFIAKLKESKLKADMLTFVQKLPHTQPKYKYHVEWDNTAAIPITSFQHWWEKRLPQVTRKNIRRAGKRGVVAKIVEFNDELVKGIVDIHNDSPIRQGIPFAHFGKEFDVVKEDYGTYLDRSDFIGAYYEGELIGIIKLLQMGEIASIMQILTKTQHYEKRPTNILIAKAVEVCERKGISFLVYGKYIYGNKIQSSLTEFKRRNGFEKILLPKYYIPLTLKGRVAIRFKLHLGLLGILPGGVISFLRALRSRYQQIKVLHLKSPGRLQIPGQDHQLRDEQDEGG